MMKCAKLENSIFFPQNFTGRDGRELAFSVSGVHRRILAALA